MQNIRTLASYPDISGGRGSHFYYNRTNFYSLKTSRKIAEDYGINPDKQYNRFGLKCPEIARGYREKFVCFDCHHYSKTQYTSIRRENVYGYQTDYEIKLCTEKNPTCPKCHREKVYVGPKFSPPKKNDIQKWNELKLKYEKDHRIFNYSYDEFADRTVGHAREKNK